jgi:hypothetical protein
MIKKIVGLFLLLILLALTACTQTSDPDSTISFPRQKKTKGERAVRPIYTRASASSMPWTLLDHR